MLLGKDVQRIAYYNKPMDRRIECYAHLYTVNARVSVSDT